MNQSKDMANLKFQMLDQARKFNMYDYLYEHFICSLHFLHILSKEFRAEVQKMRVIKRKLGNFNLYPHKLHNTAFRPLGFALTYHFLCIVIYNQSYLQHIYQNLPNGAKFEGNQIIEDINGICLIMVSPDM